MTQQVLSSAGAIKESNSFGNAGYGTSLPASPTDGMEYILVDNVSTPTYQWRLRYNTGSANTDKWEFVGGAPASSQVATSEGTTNAAYAALTTAGPSIALPRAGVYDITIGAASQADTNTGIMSYDIGGTGAVDGDGIYLNETAAGPIQGARTQRKTGLTAVTLTAKYKRLGGAGTTDFINRYMHVTPVRVS